MHPVLIMFGFRQRDTDDSDGKKGSKGRQTSLQTFKRYYLTQKVYTGVLIEGWVCQKILNDTCVVVPV